MTVSSRLNQCSRFNLAEISRSSNGLSFFNLRRNSFGASVRASYLLPQRIISFQTEHVKLMRSLDRATEQDLYHSMKFLVNPREIKDIPRFQFLWFVYCDHIHHRGQFSVYLRMAGGKVPSIYGPSADEPWF